jgi:hypothetical protein
VATLQDGRIVNVDGATVSLAAGGGAVLQSTTDAFGDFKFDGLTRGGDDYRLHIAHDLGSAERGGRLLDSAHLGSIELQTRQGDQSASTSAM